MVMLELAKKATKVYKVYREKGAEEVLRRAFHRVRYLSYRVRGPIINLKIMGVKIRMYTPTYPDFHIVDYVARTEHYLQRELVRELKEGIVIWDVGANVGLYSCFLGKYSSNVTVVAFEPNPVVVERLKKNVSLNGLRNVQIVDVALWDVDSNLTFDVVWSEHPSLHGRVVTHSEGNQGNLVMVKAMRGDSLVEKGLAPPPDIIKVDVEGGEIEVIRGMDSVLNDCRVLFIEVHPAKGVDTHVLECMLVKAGFEVERFGWRDQDFWIKATNNRIRSEVI